MIPFFQLLYFEEIISGCVQTFEERLIFNACLLHRLYLFLFTSKIKKTSSLPEDAQTFDYRHKQSLK